MIKSEQKGKRSATSVHEAARRSTVTAPPRHTQTRAPER
ncbi:hypothetical protein SAMN06272775_3695 [Streptomyces sp. 2323.1]|nr:hypothetical protein SAMN06272775_3695 [Streptomyces sp. 2323.1]